MGRPSLYVAVASLVVIGVGGVDAAIGRVWDLFALFVALAVLQGWALLRIPGNRVWISLRPDLAQWAKKRSQSSGEPVEAVIDRSVAWFQHGLYGAGQVDDD